jgi:hypothetical protein
MCSDTLKAISWLAEKEVDIVSMALAFGQQKLKIERAIRKAIGLHDVPVLFFAAASNDKHYSKNPVGHPARMDEVIRVNSCTYHGIKSSFSPSSDKKDNALGTIGEEILSAYSQQKYGIRTEMRQSGTSMATAVMTGIAGLVIEFMKFTELPHNDTREMQMRLHSCSGMKAVLSRCMSANTALEPHNYIYVMPWLLFSESHEHSDVVRDINRALDAGI